MNCIAIDLHTDNFTVARRRMVNGKSVKTLAKYDLDDNSISQFASTLTKEYYVAIESTLNSFWFHDRLAPFVRKVIIFDTHKVNFKGNKTDKIDAKKLLDILEYYVYIKGESEIPKVYVPEDHIRELREMFSTYTLLKKIKVQQKNRIHSIFKQHGQVIKRKNLDSEKGKQQILTASINQISKFQIEILIQEIRNTENQLQKILEMIMALAMKYFKDEMALLMTIPGISCLSAIALLSDIADISRFPNVKKYCSYLRTAPKIKASNKKAYLGKVNKCSRSLTVTMLTQSIRHFRDSSEYFDNFYLRLKSGKSYGKTRIALIRKILVCSYYMLKRNENFKWSSKSDLNRKHNDFARMAEKIDLDEIKSA